MVDGQVGQFVFAHTDDEMTGAQQVGGLLEIEGRLVRCQYLPSYSTTMGRAATAVSTSTRQAGPPFVRGMRAS